MVVSVPRRLCLITSYLIPRKRVILEKRILAQIGRKPPSFYGILTFIQGSERCLIFLCSKSCASKQYLEDFSRYVAEMHAVFQVSVCQSCFTKKIFGTMFRFQLPISQLTIILLFLKLLYMEKTWRNLQLHFCNFYLRKSQKGHKTSQSDTQQQGLMVIYYCDNQIYWTGLVVCLVPNTLPLQARKQKLLPTLHTTFSISTFHVQSS